MRVVPYSEERPDRWDEFVGRCPAGTFLHTRRFLAYHGRRFRDCSVVCTDEDDRLLGVFPAAFSGDGSDRVGSHPGATFGGLLFADGDSAERVEEMIAAIVRHYASLGARQLEYKSVPSHLHAVPAHSDVRAIWKLGAELSRRDLWNVLPVAARPGYSSHHRRAIARAQRQGVLVEVSGTDESYRAFHAMLEARLAEQYGASPVHTPEEMILLRDRFPQEISLWLARDAKGRTVAGTWVFMFGSRAWHTQYIASTPEGRELRATHLLFDGLIREAEARGIRHVSFGCSTEDDGRRVNTGLFAFKAGFGAGAACHDFYRVTLS